MSSLLSIKTGGCEEDCSYCSQSSSYDSGLAASKIIPLEQVIDAAKNAKKAGATRFCMGAAWRNPKERDMPKIIEMVKAVKDLELETCVTLGFVSPEQAGDLKEAGLDYYNHNIDTSEEYYKNVVSSHSFSDRTHTLSVLREKEIKLCTGGIIGMGETRTDRANMLRTLSCLPKHPESVPINMLVPIPGTPFGDLDQLDSFELIRTIAVARIMMPHSYVRLSAGRMELNDHAQSLCFLAGANSIFCGDRLLTTKNADNDADMALFATLGLKPEQHFEGKISAAE
jgi:biotin synthase